MSLRRGTWAAIAAVAVLAAVLATYLAAEQYFSDGRGGSAGLTIRESEPSDHPVVDIDPDHVQARLPEFHALLEEALGNGIAYTSNDDLIQDIWDYIEDVSESIDRNIEVHYKDKVFQLEQDIQ